MGTLLGRMIRDCAPASWTPNMRLLAMVIADDAWDPNQAEPGRPAFVSKIRIHGGYSDNGDGKWYDGLAERAGMSEHTILRTLTALGQAGFEMRAQLANEDGHPMTDRRGRPVFAYRGYSPTFRVPTTLKPRDPPPRNTRRSARSADLPGGGDWQKVGQISQEGRPDFARRSARSAHPPYPSHTDSPTDIDVAGVSDGSLEGKEGRPDLRTFNDERRRQMDELERQYPEIAGHPAAPAEDDSSDEDDPEVGDDDFPY